MRLFDFRGEKIDRLTFYGFCGVFFIPMSTEPEKAVGKVLFRRSESDLSFFLHDSTADPRPTHSVMGNPNRFTSGSVKISYGGEWEKKLSLV